MFMQRHDLLRVEPAAWRAMLDLHPHLTSLPLVEDWVSQGWPVIVRRPMAGDPNGGTPAALPLPPIHGKRRVGFSFVSRDGLMAAPATLLADAASAAPPAWRPVINALVALGEAVGVAPHVYGALLWAHLTGLDYLTQTSDLDLLWSVPDEATAVALLAGLKTLDADSPVRLDGEVVLADGRGVNWRELANAQTAGGDVLVKTMAGVATCDAADLFAPASVT